MKQRFSPPLNSYVWVLVTAILMRFLYLKQALDSNPLLFYPLVDAEVYRNWAQAILHNGTLIWPTPINYTPAYPLYLAGLLFIGGNNVVFVFAVNLLLGAIQAVLLGKTAEIVWKNHAYGLLTGFISAIYWPFIIFEASFYAESSALVALTASLYIIVRHLNRRTNSGLLLIAGFCLAYAALARPHVFILFFPFTAFLLLTTSKSTSSDSGKMRVKKTALFLFPAIFLSCLITIGNGLKTNSWQLRTMTSVNLYLGNDPALHGMIIPPGIEWDALMLDAVNNEGAYQRNGNDYWQTRTVHIIKNQFPDWFRLQMKKLFTHFGNQEVSQEIDTYYYRNHSPLLANIPLPGFSIILAAAFAGILFGPRNRTSWLLLILCVVYAMGMFPFQSASRFRLPLVLLLIPFAGCGVNTYYTHLKDKHIGKTVAETAVFTFIVLLTLPDFTGIAKRNTIRNRYYEAMKLRDEKKTEQAYGAFIQAMEEDKTDPNAPLQLGYMNTDKQQYIDAIGYFQESLTRVPCNHAANQALALCYIRTQQYEKANQHIQKALSLYPNYPQTLELGITAAVRQKNINRALEYTQRLRTIDPEDPHHLIAAAVLMDIKGDIQEAANLYGLVVQSPRAPLPIRQKALLYQGCLEWQIHRNYEALCKRWKEHPELTSPLIQQFLNTDNLHEASNELLTSYLAYIQVCANNGSTNRNLILENIIIQPTTDLSSQQATVSRWFQRELSAKKQ